jgi:hypothetical protein
MQVSDRKPTEDQEILEPQDREELRRVAHKIAWTRMNGSIDPANPFLEAAHNHVGPVDGLSGSSHHR